MCVCEKYESTRPATRLIRTHFNPLKMTRFLPTTRLTRPDPPVLPCLGTHNTKNHEVHFFFWER